MYAQLYTYIYINKYIYNMCAHLHHPPGLRGLAKVLSRHKLQLGREHLDHQHVPRGCLANTAVWISKQLKALGLCRCLIKTDDVFRCVEPLPHLLE